MKALVVVLTLFFFGTVNLACQKKSDNSSDVVNKNNIFEDEELIEDNPELRCFDKNNSKNFEICIKDPKKANLMAIDLKETKFLSDSWSPINFQSEFYRKYHNISQPEVECLVKQFCREIEY